VLATVAADAGGIDLAGSHDDVEVVSAAVHARKSSSPTISGNPEPSATRAAKDSARARSGSGARAHESLGSTKRAPRR
jgi:hypothetical protein